MLLATAAWSTMSLVLLHQGPPQKDPKADRVRMHGPGPKTFDFMKELTEKAFQCALCQTTL